MLWMWLSKCSNKGHYGHNGLDQHTQMKILWDEEKLQPLLPMEYLTFHTEQDYSSVRRLKLSWKIQSYSSLGGQ